MPLIVVRNHTGHLVQADPTQFNFEKIANGESRVIELSPNIPLISAKRSFEIIGTLEAGFDNSSITHPRFIPDELARELFENACHFSESLCKATLLHVLELVTDSVRQITRADCASLHFPLDVNTQHFAYNVWLGPPFSRELQPRKGGLGEEAIKSGEPKAILYGKKTCKKFNKAVHSAGINSYAAFPLIFRGQQRPDDVMHPSDAFDTPLTGVLNIAFKQHRRFSKGELDSLQPFITLALDAIRNVTYHVQTLNMARQLASLHDIAKLFAGETDTQHLLWSIAGFTKNILAADTAIIYMYNPVSCRFDSRPVTAGRRQNPNSGPSSWNGTYMLPPQLAEQNQSVYARSREQLIKLYGGNDQQDTLTNFLKEEGIESAFSVLLRIGEEVIGILFVNYRHNRNFSKYEKSFIETLASTAAIAIWNRRLEVAVPQIRAKAIQEVCGIVLHEFQPKIGVLELQANKEIENYKFSDIKRQVDSLKQVINAIKGVYEAAAKLPEYRKFDLTQLIRDVVEEAGAGDGLLISLVGLAPLLVEADPNLLRLVIYNGLRNAIEAVSELPNHVDSRRIIINWGSSGDEIWLTILDNGPGLRIGAPFKLGISTKGGHSGIGLSTARLAIASMGGRIQLKPGKDGGTHFEICWQR